MSSSRAGGRTRARCWRSATSRSTSSRARRWASSAQRLGQVDAAAARLRIIKPTSGRIEAGGRVGSLLELGAGFHPDFTGRENVYLNGSIHGLSRARVRELMDEIVAFAELERFIDLPVRTYSSGMYMRLGFSVAAHIQADVLLLDEVFAVGDEAFQRKCFGKIPEFKSRGGTIVFVSHDAQAVERLCDRAVLLRQARSRSTGDPRGDRRLPPAARRGREPRGARGRAAGVGQRRGAHRLGAGCSTPTATSARSSPPASRAVRLVVASEPGVGAPRVSLELRDDGGVVLGGVTHATADLGWDGARGERELRFELDRLPLADGRFHLRFALPTPRRPAAALARRRGQFFVFPTGAETRRRAPRRPWSMQEIGAGRANGRR